MSKLKLVKDLRKEQVGLIEVLGAYVLQEKQNVDFYDESKNYKKDDIIISFNEVTKKYELKRCLKETNGIFDEDSWVIDKLHDSSNTIDKDTLYDDLLTMMDILYGLTRSTVKFNHVYINDISDTDSIRMNSGLIETGKVFI